MREKTAALGAPRSFYMIRVSRSPRSGRAAPKNEIAEQRAIQTVKAICAHDFRLLPAALPVSFSDPE